MRRHASPQGIDKVPPSCSRGEDGERRRRPASVRKGCKDGIRNGNRARASPGDGEITDCSCGTSERAKPRASLGS